MPQKLRDDHPKAVAATASFQRRLGFPALRRIRAASPLRKPKKARDRQPSQRHSDGHVQQPNYLSSLQSRLVKATAYGSQVTPEEVDSIRQEIASYEAAQKDLKAKLSGVVGVDLTGGSDQAIGDMLKQGQPTRTRRCRTSTAAWRHGRSTHRRLAYPPRPEPTISFLNRPSTPASNGKQGIGEYLGRTKDPRRRQLKRSTAKGSRSLKAWNEVIWSRRRPAPVRASPSRSVRPALSGDTPRQENFGFGQQNQTVAPVAVPPDMPRQPNRIRATKPVGARSASRPGRRAIQADGSPSPNSAANRFRVGAAYDPTGKKHNKNSQHYGRRRRLQRKGRSPKRSTLSSRQ